MCEENKNHTYHINVELNKQLNQLNFKKIIFTSSASVYGHQSKMCNEKSITNITNFYTETKMMAEEELLKKGKFNIKQPVLVVKNNLVI